MFQLLDAVHRLCLFITFFWISIPWCSLAIHLLIGLKFRVLEKAVVENLDEKTNAKDLIEKDMNKTDHQWSPGQTHNPVQLPLLFSLENWFVLQDFEKCENRNHYQPWLWVGRIDQKIWFKRILQIFVWMHIVIVIGGLTVFSQKLYKFVLYWYWYCYIEICNFDWNWNTLW